MLSSMPNLSNKTILVTGGTGSFGSTMVKHLLANDCKEVRVFSRDETKQDAMRNEFQNNKLKFYIGDIRDFDSINGAMKGVNYVFHAAALKQVPSCEFFPIQAVMTNIGGSDNVINSAIQNKIESVVCLSTDKAVYPVNAMGMSKAMMEKVAQSHARNLSNEETIISCVRYGNVMYSRGSVIPLFVKLIKEGKPLTLTNPKMTRFLMTLEQSVDLVLFAFSHAKQGDIFIRKAPASNIKDLTIALKNLFNSNAEEKIIGTRHGEKAFEALASMEELARSKEMPDYYQISMDTRGLNYNKFFTEGDISMPSEDYTSDNTEQLTVSQIEKLLLTLPEIQKELDIINN